MKRLAPLLALLMISATNAPPLKIAVIDTGLNLKDVRFKNHLCSTGHKDFTGTGLNDSNGHGTHVSGLIEKYAGNGNYCFLIYKYYTDSESGSDSLRHEIDAIREAVMDGAEIINISGGGDEFNEYESLLIKYNPQIIFVVAAGNNGENLDIPSNKFYPASYFYGNEEVVSAVNEKGTLVSFSNYGKKVENKELGEDVLSYLPGGQTGLISGTSQATAIYTGKLIRKMLNAN